MLRHNGYYICDTVFIDFKKTQQPALVKKNISSGKLEP